MTTSRSLAFTCVLLGSALLFGCAGKNSSPLLPMDDAGAHTGDDADTVDGDSYTPALMIPGSTYGNPDAGAHVQEQHWNQLPPVPQVVNDDGGVLASPTVVAVFFSNEDKTNLPKLEKFYAELGASSMWHAAEEYGVGPATAMSVVLAEAAPSSIDDGTNAPGENSALQTWLLGEIDQNLVPAPTPTTTYLINFPAGTNITGNGTMCVDFNGYHSDVANSAGTAVISYGVIPHCTVMGSTYLDSFSGTASHEVIEAATDPYPDFSPAWVQVDGAHLFFDEANSGSEIADLCENDPEAFHTFSDFPFKVQRVWSNASALAGHDPCVPEIPGKVFFNAVPELPDTGVYDFFMQNVEVSSVHIPVGGSATVYVDLYSDGDTPDWDVFVIDYNYLVGQGQLPTLLDVDMPLTSGNNGDRLPLTIKVKAAGNPALNGQLANTELFVVYSSQGTTNSAPAHVWYGVVTN